MVDYNPGILTGLVVQSDSINVDGKNYVEITGGSMGGKTVVVASAIPVTAGDVFTVTENPDTDTNLTVEGVTLSDIKATISHSGSVTDQEVATVQGYLRFNNVQNSATLPIYIDKLITSAAF